MNYKQYLVELIKKTAQAGDLEDAPVNPTRNVPAGPPPPKYGPPSMAQGNSQVKKMQQALIDLSKAVTQQINIQQLADPNQTQRTPGAPGEAAGRDSFNNFITKNYLRGSDVPGVEFDPNPKKVEMSEKTPSTPTRMGVVMETMARIGNPKSGEFAVDGKWGPRTNAGLHNAYALAYSLLGLAKDFGVKVTAYGAEALEKFKQMIPSDEATTHVLDKVESAPLITEQLKAIQAMYEEIKASVLEKPAYRAYIEGDQPFATYEKAGANLTSQQMDAINAAFANKLQVYNKPISINDLLTVDALKAWVQKNVPQAPVENVLAQLKQQAATQARDTRALSERE